MSDERMAAIEAAIQDYGDVRYDEGVAVEGGSVTEMVDALALVAERALGRAIKAVALALLSEPESPAISEAEVEAVAAVLSADWYKDGKLLHREWSQKLARKVLDAARRAREGATE